MVPFLLFGFAFLFITTSLLGTTGPRGFPQPTDSVLRTGGDSFVSWKSTVATIVLPIKIVLIGPLMPYIAFLRQEPDTLPPFFVIGFIFYWTILALITHYVLGKLKKSSSKLLRQRVKSPDAVGFLKGY